MKLFSRKDMLNFAAEIRILICIQRLLSHRKMISNCAEFILQTDPGHGERSILRVTQKLYLRHLLLTHLHPAFSNLFVQTEIIHERHAILCTRRPRSLEEQTPWMFHMMVVRGANIEKVSFETDRMQFIGRGNTISRSTSDERFYGSL